MRPPTATSAAVAALAAQRREVRRDVALEVRVAALALAALAIRIALDLIGVTSSVIVTVARAALTPRSPHRAPTRHEFIVNDSRGAGERGRREGSEG
jgi:hypothetical protein